MKLTNPNGLWLLVGIPILILIYLIKSSHQDRPMSSTYLWRLSRRFAKKRLPFQRWRRFLLFLLQLLMIAAAAFVAAKPVVPEGECFDFVVILDASAGMQMENDDGQSRYDRAVSQILTLGRELSDGHTMTVIHAAEVSTTLVEGATTASEVKVALENVPCTNRGCDMTQAIAMAQKVCDRSENAKVMFYTDRTPAQAGNIHVLNLDEAEFNISVQDLTVTEEGKNLHFTGSLLAYPKDAEVAVGLRLNGRAVDAKMVKCEGEKITEVTFTVKNTADFETAEIYIEKEDGLDFDNRFAICRPNKTKQKILLASESPLYLETALSALGGYEVTVVYTPEEIPMQGMDLYIFDGILPDGYPTDGSVLVFGTDNLPEGLMVASTYEEQTSIMMENANHPICVDLLLDSAVVKNYGDLVGNDSWEDVLFCGDAVVAATSKRENNTRMTVFSFDIHDTNLPLQRDFLLLMRNLVDFSMPRLIDEYDYTVGDTVKIGSVAVDSEIYLKLPDGSTRTLYAGRDGCSVIVSEPGLYTIAVNNGEVGAYADFFVRLPVGEPYAKTEDVINIALTPATEETKREAFAGIWFWIAMGILLVLLIEWEWYYYEQY